MDTTPASLLERLTGPSDPAAWTRFVRLFTPLLDRWARRLGVPEADAEDLMQEVFAVLVRRLPEFHYDSGRSFRAWLWTVFYHAVIGWRKRQAALPRSIDQPDEVAATDGTADVEEAEYHQYLVGRALGILRADFPEATWKMFWEVAVGGRPGVEVAREFGTTPNAVYLARSRVLSRLRQELAGLD